MKNPLRSYVKHYSQLSKNTWKQLSVSLLFSTANGMIYFLSLYLVKDRNFSITTANLSISLFGIGMLLGSFIAGKLHDKLSFDFRAIIALSGSILFVLLGISTTHFFINLEIFTLGILIYGFRVLNTSRILSCPSLNNHARLKVISTLSMISNLGLALGVIIVSINTFIGFRCAFFLSAILMLSAFFWLLLTNNKSAPHKAITPSTNSMKPQKQKRLQLDWMILFSTFLIGMVFSQIRSTYPIFLFKTFPKLGTQAFSILFIANTLLVISLQTPLTNILERFNKGLIISIGALLSGLGLALLIFANQFWIAIISCIIWSFGEMLFFSIAQLALYEKTPSRYKGSAIGWFRLVFATSSISGPAIGGILYDYNPTVLWLACGATGIAVCIMLLSNIKNYLTISTS